jgi:hypothetical protein
MKFLERKWKKIGFWPVSTPLSLACFLTEVNGWDSER